MPDISVLVIDDNSGDGTNELIDDLKQKFENLFLLKREGNSGYGKAILDGMKWAIDKEFDCVITMDADFSHDFKSIPDIIKELEVGDVVLGSRYTQGGKIENWSFSRKLLSRVANSYVRRVLGLSFGDITTGFVGYRKKAVQKLVECKLKSEGYAFLVESKYLLSKASFSIGEYPIIFRERRQGQSKMSYKIIWEAVWMPWKLKLCKT
jgi:dolichol-phosphate mannosyltransferase